jgi:hypothetical protein
LVDTVRTLAALQALIDDGGNNTAQDVRDFLISVYPVWEDFTPVWTAASTAPAIGNGTLAGRFVQLGTGTGSLVVATIRFQAGGTTTFGTGAWRFTFPVEPAQADAALVYGIGSGYLENNAVKGYPATVAIKDVAGTKFVRVIAVETDGSAIIVSNTGPFTWGDNDYFNITFSYEVA